MGSFHLPLLRALYPILSPPAISLPGIDQHLEKEVTPLSIFYLFAQPGQTQDGPILYAGGNINPEGVSMFESIGGSAPKYTGQNVINPIASICSVAMLVDSLGEELMGKAIDNAVLKTTPKLKTLSAGRMGYSTSEVGDLVVEALRNGS